MTERTNEAAVLIAKWSGCWCAEQQYPDHDPRVRDCPQHGSDDCRHMAEGIVADLRSLAAHPSPEPPTGDGGREGVAP